MARSLTLDGDAASAAASKQGAPSAETSFSPDENILYGVFAAGVVGNIVLQKIAVPFGGTALPIAMPLFMGAMLLALAMMRPQVDPIRIGGLLAFFIVGSLSTMFLAPRYSASSLLLFGALYVPMLVSFETTAANYRRCMDLFITVMLVFVGITIAQHMVQIVGSYKAWPNLNTLLPQDYLIPDYNYLQPVVYGSRLMKPNGVAFLEVSLLSQYIALGLALELVFFRRPARVIAFTAGLMLTLAGTGPLLMLLTLPVLLGRMRIRNAALTIALLMIVSLIALKLGWFDVVSARMDEYKHNGSSSNMRFIVPFERTLIFLQDPMGLISGIGAGQIEKVRGFIWWPFTKATIEYGLVTGILFYAFLLYTVFRNAPDRVLAFVLVVWYSFEGTLLTSFSALTLAMLGTLLRPAPGSGPIAPDFRPDRDDDVVPQPAPVPRAARASRGPSASQPRAKIAPTTSDKLQINRDLTGKALIETLGAPDTGGRLVYAIGDIHGRADLFASLIEAIRADIAAHPGFAEKPMIVLLGDYVDRGPTSAQVIDQILELEKDPTIEVCSILGNHEDAMIAFLDERSSGVSWGRHGGTTTVSSYGLEAPSGDATALDWAALRGPFRAAVPPEHDAYLRRLKHYVVVGGVIFVHAGLRPGVPLEKQRLKDILYIREDFLDAPVDSNLLIVHGHTPYDEAYGAQGRICLDTGAYATGVLTAARFDGRQPALIDARAGRGSGRW